MLKAALPSDSAATAPNQLQLGNHTVADAAPEENHDQSLDDPNEDQAKPRKKVKLSTSTSPSQTMSPSKRKKLSKKSKAASPQKKASPAHDVDDSGLGAAEPVVEGSHVLVKDMDVDVVMDSQKESAVSTGAITGSQGSTVVTPTKFVSTFPLAYAS